MKRVLLAAGTASYDWPDYYPALDEVPDALRIVVEALKDAGFTTVVPSPGYSLNPELESLCTAVQMAAAAAPVVVVYYTGHGANLERGSYYLVSKTSRPADLSTSALEARKLLELLSVRDDDLVPLENQPAALVILDCCQSGSAGMEMLQDELLRRIGNPSICVIASAGPLEDAQQGVFAKAFRDALQQLTAGPSQQYLTLEAITQAINDAHVGRARQQARFYPPGTGLPGIPPFFRNPLYRPGLAGQTVADQQLWMSRVRGGPEESTTGFYLTGKTGRLRAAERLATWMTDPASGGLAVVTGSPGTGKSALLALPVLLTDQSRGADLVRAAKSGSLIQHTASLLPADTPVTPVYTRGLSADQAADVIARALGREAATASQLLKDLDATPEQRRRVILVDAVDEAVSPDTMLDSLLVPLARQPRLQVAVGARRPVAAQAGDADLTIDLDASDYRDPQALTEYAYRLLIASEEPGVTTAYTPGAVPGRGDRSEAAAKKMAAVIAQRATGRDGGAESFLIARQLALYARASTDPAGISSEGWQADTAAIVAGVFDEDLARLGGKAPRARALLTALAWAKGPGLPWENIWVPVARALAEGSDAGQPPITDNDVRWLLDKAGAYIVEDLGSGGRSVYRPFHDMLAGHLRGEPNTEPQRARIEQRITNTLLATVPVDSQGRRDWPTAHPYLRTYLTRHAEAAGPETANLLAHDPGFLPVADPVIFDPMPPGLFRDSLVSAVEQAWSVYNIRPWWLEVCPPDHIELWLRGNPSQKLPANEARARARENVARARAREQVISCGAALFNLRLAIRVAGHDLVAWPLPDLEYADPMNPPALLASAEIVTGRIKKPAIWEQELYEAIWRWRTNEWPYTIPVPLPVIATMEDAAAQEGAHLRLLHPRQAKKWMRLAAKADSDPAFIPPFRNYVSPADYGPPPKNRYPRTRKDFWLDTAPQRFERKPQLMALSTDDDEPADWLRAGQALQRAILTGTRYSVSAQYGLSVSFLTQPLEYEDIAGLARQWPWQSRSPEFPQAVMRVGYTAVPTSAPQSPAAETRDLT